MAKSTRRAKKPGSSAVETRIGSEVKRLRKRQGLSLRGFADRLNFSPSFISQLERGLVSPSIASLERIATLLEVTLRDFFATPRGKSAPVVRATERPSFRSAWSQAQIAALTPPDGRRSLEALMVTLEPGGRSAKNPTPSTHDQFALVFDGTVELTLHDDALTLRRGDAVQIPSGTPHRWQNRWRRAAQIVLVSTGLV